MTDPGWLATLAAGGASEVNFWQPGASAVREAPGTPWIFKVKGTNTVGGFGFFMYWTSMPIAVAWEAFGVANGVASYSELRKRLRELRHGEDDGVVGCVVLSDVVVLAAHERLAAPADWKRQTVSRAGYDMEHGEGARIWAELRLLDRRAAQPAFSPLVAAPGGYLEPKLVASRRGQGAFRLMVMDAYERRCAVTGERTLPVLEAAHIRPFAEVATHEVSNGILMRSDLHKLYDAGLVTVLPDLTFRVSRAIDREYSNGKIYYAIDGSSVRVPSRPDARPDPQALADHAARVFRS